MKNILKYVYAYGIISTERIKSHAQLPNIYYHVLRILIRSLSFYNVK